MEIMNVTSNKTIRRKGMDGEGEREGERERGREREIGGEM
jgi:hypothetical protein